VFALNRVLGSSRTSVSVELGTEGPRLVPLERGETLLTALAPVARSAAELLVSAEPSRIRRCSSDTCDRWFIDTSKGGRRKWCSMATCGNRAKAESHRKRHAAA
jgi:predicted RNA-binding Zn ribbon-like protein